MDKADKMKNAIGILLIIVILGVFGCAKRPVYRPMVYLSRVKVPAQVRGGVFIPEHTEYVYVLVNPNDSFITRGPLAYSPTFLNDTVADSATLNTVTNDLPKIPDDPQKPQEDTATFATEETKEPAVQKDTLVLYFRPYAVKLTNEHKAYLNNFFSGKKFQEVTIETYTDSLGSPSFNLKLSRERARNLRDYIQGAFNVKKVIIRPRGATNFVAPNDTEYNRLLNRRAVIVTASRRPSGKSRGF